MRSLVRTPFLRLGAVGLALFTGVALAHCGGDDADGGEIPTDDTGIVDETSVDTGMGDDTAVDTGTDDTGSDDTGSADDSGAAETSSGDATTDGSSEAASDGGSEAASDGAATETGGDTAIADSGPDVLPDGADAAVVCGTLSATATDVYVDKSSAMPSVGTLACPFHTIKEGTDLAAVTGRTIHVKGGSGSTAVTYTETGLLAVKAGVTLLGDGELVTKIVASAACAGGGNCAVQVANGATIDGFDVTSAGNGIVTTDGTTPAVVQNVTVHDAQDGIVVLGTANFGSATAGGNVQAKSNKQNGVHVKGMGTLHVYSTTLPATDNSFSVNDGEGILVEGSARLVFDGGTANNNKSNGVHLASTVVSSTTARHEITGLTAKFNGRSATGMSVGSATGLVIDSGSSARVLNSVFLGNTQNGLTFARATGALPVNTLNLGDTPVTAAGNNTFGVTDPASNNSHFAVCIDDASADDQVVAEGDKWAACAATVPAVPQAAVSGGNCGAATNGGSVGYKKAGGATVTRPVKITPVTGCFVGP